MQHQAAFVVGSNIKTHLSRGGYPRKREPHPHRRATLSPSVCHAIFRATKRERMEFKFKSQIMDATAMTRALSRLASEIVERNTGTRDLLLVGIRRRGVPLAERIADKIEQLEGTRPPTGQLDITLYRDDLSTVGPRPVVNKTDIPVDVTDSTIVLVDDVLYTGRTVRAALDELVDFGRPRKVELAVLIDRGHRELPIQADYVGKDVQTTDTEIIKVMLKEYDEDEQVIIVESE
jgi:pyrimidine operon attenuation protein / uracil phosphoribosyltransferase